MSSVQIQGNSSGTGVFTIASPNSSSSFTATLPAATTTLVGTDATQTLTNKTIQGGAITSGTAVASTSGTSIDFTGIPSWVKRITVMLSGVSTNGSSIVLIRLGTASGVVTTGYSNVGAVTTGSGVGTQDFTSGFGWQNDTLASYALSGSFTINLLSANTYTFFGGAWITTNRLGVGAGAVTLSAILDRVRITTVNGTDTFDAGSINILYE